MSGTLAKHHHVIMNIVSIVIKDPMLETTAIV